MPTLPKIFRPVTRNTLIFLFGLRVHIFENYFSYFSAKTYIIVGTLKFFILTFLITAKFFTTSSVIAQMYQLITTKVQINFKLFGDKHCR